MSTIYGKKIKSQKKKKKKKNKKKKFKKQKKKKKMWSDKFELPDGSYSVLDIQYYC